jgi:predicted transcriptional regulator
VKITKKTPAQETEESAKSNPRTIPGLQQTVLQILQERQPLSVNEILDEVNERIKDKSYKSGAIFTILGRLEKKKVVEYEKHEGVRIYHIRKDAPKREILLMLDKFVARFGKVGIKQLGDVLGTEFSEEELEELRRELELEERENHQKETSKKQESS